MRRRALITGLSPLLAMPMMARAQPVFPRGPVRLIVPYGPGGGSDLIARIMAQQASAATAGSFLVENRPGSTLPGIQAVVQASADGHVLGIIDMSLVINPSLFGADLPYDTLRDLAPVGRIATAPVALVVPQASPLRRLEEAVAAMRDGAQRIAHAGDGTAPHLAGLQFRRATGGGAVLQNMRGGGRAVAALAGGEEAIGLVVLPSALAQIEGGELRALAMTRPSPLLPDVPGFAAAGLAAVDAEAFWGVIAPAATPAALIERLNALLVRPVTEAAVTVRLQRLGYVAAATSPSEFGIEIRRGIARWQTLAGRPG